MSQNNDDAQKLGDSSEDNLHNQNNPEDASSSSIPQMSKRTSQPRLSIHSLMNDSNDTQAPLNTDNTKVADSMQPPPPRAIPTDDLANEKPMPTSSIPKPSESISSKTEAPSVEQAAMPFLPSTATGIDTDSIQKNIKAQEKEPTMQTLNSTESQSKEAVSRIKSKNSISALTNSVDVELPQSEAPPLPEIKSSEKDIIEGAEEVKEENVKAIHGVQSKSSSSIDEDVVMKDDLMGIKPSEQDENGSSESVDTKPKPEPIYNQIQKLEQLKQKQEEEDDIDVAPNDGKPRRYKTKPIWARDYVPSIQHSAMGADSSRSRKVDVPLGGISKLEIPSITGSIPRNDFNKLVTEWIWANVEGVKQDYKDVPNVTDYIEIEMKLGNVWDKVKDCRIQLPVNTECVVATDYINQECYFKPGITLQNFNDTKAYLNKLIQEATEQQQLGRGNINNKFVIENSHVVDMIASDSRRNDKPISGRVSFDVKTKRKTNSISKQRISDLYLHLPNTLFDVRMSLSIELPNELNDAAFEIFKKRVTMEREKERTSYIHQATFTRIDLTKVREKNNRIPKYELELEINTPALLRSMHNVMEDPLYYIDLVQAFLDNGRIITRHLSLQRQ